MSEQQNPIFYDPKGVRQRLFRRAIIGVVIVTIVFAAIFIASVSIFNPQLPNLILKPTVARNADNDGTPDWAAEADAKQTAPNREKRRFVPQRRTTAQPVKVDLQTTATNAKPISIGFYVNWDDTSLASLKRNAKQLDWLVPEWIRLQDKPQSDTDLLIKDFDQHALDVIQKEKPGMPILPLVQNYVDEEWNPPVLARSIRDEATREKFVNALLETVESNHFGGVTIDLEDVPTDSHKNLIAFMERLHAVFQQHNLIVAQAVPFDNPDWDYQTYAKNTDFVMLMAYDQHWSTSAPGTIVAQNWFETTLQKRMSELDPAKTIVCIGNYGYNWSTKHKEAPEVSFQESVLAARDSDAEIKFDAASKTPYFTYQDEDGSKHSVWFLDAASAFNQISFARKLHPFGFALWRMGSEDPSLWNVFGTDRLEDPQPENLSQIKYGYDIDFEGTGEILNVTSEPQDGKRELTFDTNGSIKNEEYTETPSTYVIQRTGDIPKKVALTFDDGPDATWTPQILDVLKQENVKAAFFIVGQNGSANPELVKRIVAEGHDLGNHSFTHPNMGEMPESVNQFEMNATQRLIESLTGRSTTLMRPPYFGDAEPQTADEVEPIVQAKKLGYITVGLHVDPDDWQQPGADEIVKRTIEGVTNQSLDADQRGNIVLLHDAGGNRQQTIDALPQIIEKLHAQGYEFVTISQLAGLSQAQTMPIVPQQQTAMTQTNGVTFYGVSLIGWLLKILFFAGVILGVARLVVIGSLATAAWARGRRNTVVDAAALNAFEEHPLVSVIVPAFNEEKVIVKTINSLLASDYHNLEIIIVDDGSPDNTSAVVETNFANEQRVRLFRKTNAGKGEALNYGFAHSSGEIVIGLDADTIFERNTISELIKPFADEKVGAAAGNAKVGNRINMITKWQALEYITSQNLDRRAFAALNAIMVVPGAVGAWRRSAIEAAGGFLSNTLAEDQDLTIKVRMLGYKIAFAERAVAWTEAPDTFRGLIKQRFRWSFGTLQCVWKHRRALLNSRYGWLGWAAMPNVWLFQIFFQIISPLMDASIIWAFVAFAIERLQHPREFDSSKLLNVLFYYLLFLAVDVAASAMAFIFETGEKRSLLWWIPVQRFGYRQAMYAVMVRSVSAAIRGAIVGWNKIERKATVDNRV